MDFGASGSDDIEMNMGVKKNLLSGSLAEVHEQHLLKPRDQCKGVLLGMHYSLIQIDTLFDNEPGIETLDDALQMLEKTNQGYLHKFVPDRLNNNLCKICHDE